MNKQRILDFAKYLANPRRAKGKFDLGDVTQCVNAHLAIYIDGRDEEPLYGGSERISRYFDLNQRVAHLIFAPGSSERDGHAPSEWKGITRSVAAQMLRRLVRTGIVDYTAAIADVKRHRARARAAA